MKLNIVLNKILFYSVVLLLILELGARYGLGLGDPPLSIAHPTIEYMFKPSQNVKRFHNHFYVNKYGMRSNEFPEEKIDDTEMRIMFFGDSVLNGGNLTSHENLATTLLQDYLNKNKTNVVGNISAGSWGPGNWLGYVNQYGFFDANTIVILMSGHDIADNPSFTPLDPNTHPTEKPFLALTEGVSRYLMRYLSIDKSAENTQDTKKLSRFNIEKGYKILNEFINIAKSKGIKVILIYHPEEDELKTGIRHQGYSYIKQLADQQQLNLVEFYPYLESSIKSGFNPYRDKIHINEIGQQALFELFKKILNPQ